MSHSTAKPVPPLAASRRALLLASLGVVAAMTGCGGENEQDTATAAGSPAPVPAPGPSSGSGGTTSSGSTSGNTSGSPSAPAPSPSTPPPPPASPPEWNVSSLFFTAGTASAIDLNNTLPAGVQPGGRFGVSTEGAALPDGMTLSPAGMLSVGSAAAGNVSGVVFTYSEPI